MNSRQTPILLLIYNRPALTAKLWEHIAAWQPERLYIAADGPKPDQPADAQRCEAVRNITEQITWQVEVKRLYRPHNLGLGRAVSEAVSWFLAEAQQGIILEDDCLPHPDFFRFCTQLLHRYSDNENVMHISGNNFHHGKTWGQESYFASRFSHVWGWATWQRAWQHFDLELKGWQHFKQHYDLVDILPHPPSVALITHWLDQLAAGKEHSSWAYPWFFAILQRNGLALTPQVNLVENIGFSGDATHTLVPNHRLMLTAQAIGELSHPDSLAFNKAADLAYMENVFAPRYTLRERLIGRYRRWRNR